MIESLAPRIERAAVDCENRFQRIVALHIHLDGDTAAYRQTSYRPERLRIHFELRRLDAACKHARHSRTVTEFRACYSCQARREELNRGEPPVVFAQHRTGKENNLIVIRYEGAVPRHHQSVAGRTDRQGLEREGVRIRKANVLDYWP